MIRTKHLVVSVSVIGVLLVGALIYSHTKTEVQTTSMYMPVQFATPNGQYVVADTEGTREDVERVRESLIAKLLDRLKRDDTLLAPTVDVTEADVVAHDTGGTVLGSDTQGVSLGDGMVTTVPQDGALWFCGVQGNESVITDAPWIRDAFWYPEEKPTIDGQVPWNGVVEQRIEGTSRVLLSNALPVHGTGIFPIHAGDDAAAYTDTFATIFEQSIGMSVPRLPSIETPRCISSDVVGVARNGVPIYVGSVGVQYDAGAHTLTDTCAGHPAADGTYHYHSESECLFDRYYEGAASTLLGYARDGFGIFAQREADKIVTNKDLDQCHGHMHEIPWDGALIPMYHYHFTGEYPYSVGCFMGEPAPIVPAETFSRTSTQETEDAATSTVLDAVAH